MDWKASLDIRLANLHTHAGRGKRNDRIGDVAEFTRHWGSNALKLRSVPREMLAQSLGDLTCTVY
eukprot:1185341-Prorocentrum_minimum.AAC.4